MVFCIDGSIYFATYIIGSLYIYHKLRRSLVVVIFLDCILIETFTLVNETSLIVQELFELSIYPFIDYPVCFVLDVAIPDFIHLEIDATVGGKIEQSQDILFADFMDFLHFVVRIQEISLSILNL